MLKCSGRVGVALYVIFPDPLSDPENISIISAAVYSAGSGRFMSTGMSRCIVVSESVKYAYLSIDGIASFDGPTVADDGLLRSAVSTFDEDFPVDRILVDVLSPVMSSVGRYENH